MKDRASRKLIYNIWLSLLIISYGLFSYYYFGGWWNSSVGTALIVFFSYLTWKEDFLKATGLKIDLTIAVKTIILTGLIVICSLGIMNYIDNEQSISIQFSNWKNYYHDVFYILNEEIVLGAIILFRLVEKYKIKPIFASVGLAFLFAIVHYGFYKWVFASRTTLEYSTLGTLFLVGFIRNNLILQKGHIGYSWAIHFGWMVVMLGSTHLYIDTEKSMAEPESFNTYLGSIELLVISIILAFCSIIYWMKGKAVYQPGG